ncbi:Ig-like domain-containing protein [Salinicola acroporae]|uniref:Cadherin domain-containing protein n=1 Tax=Salinicola acroporae TaxID=1541440 RepID=A0ABT6I3K7_9GAMM|nr:hypothetical protein [Salinicola acroporae]
MTITVTGTNDVPVAKADTQTTGENATLTSQVPAATDVDGTVESYQLVNGVGNNNGSLSFNSDGSYSFNPGADFDGLAAGQSRDVTFSYTATDNNGGVSAPQTVTITVTGTNDVPVAKADTQTTGENAILNAQVPAATDVDGTVESYQLVNGVGNNNGSLSFNSDGSYTFNPGADFDGLAAGQSRDVTFSYTATDNNGGVSAPQTVTITVTGTNDVPVAKVDTQTTGENATLTSQVPAATDVDGTVESYQLVNGVGNNNGSLSFNSDGSYTFNPGADFDGLAAGQSRDVTFSYTATDNNGGVSAPQTVNITVTGTNDVPVAKADTQTTGENAILTVNAAQGVLANDSDVDGGTLSVSAVNGVVGSVGQAIAGSNGGTFTLNADGSYSFNPGTAFDRLAAGQTDTTQISYTVSDGQGGTATSTLTVTVTGTNDVPVAKADTQTTGENATLTSQVPAATDVDGTVESYQLVNGVGDNNGSLSFNSNGSYSFNPGADFDGLAAGQSRDVTFSYTATDNNGGVSAPQTVTITVTGTNDVPVAKADTQTTGENATLNVTAAQGVLANDSDVDGGTLSVSAVNGVAGSVGQAIAGSNGGTFTLNADGSYSFNPGTAFDRLAAGQTDTTQISYTVSDGQGGTATSTLTVTVTGTNDVPVAKADTQTTGENATLTSQVPAATDVDGTVESYQLVNGVGDNNGSLSFNSNGSYSFNPGADFDGLAAGQSRDVTFSYTATDNNGGVSAPQTVTITVTGTNDVPVAKADTQTTGENATLNVTAAQGVLANDSDVDGGTLSVSAVNGVAGSVGQAIAGSNGGTFTLNADGSYSFNPGTAFDRLAAGQTDTTQISYTVSDGLGGTATATLTVTVTGTNDVPVAKADTQTTGENATLTSQVPAATDVDGTVESYQLVNGVGNNNGSLSFNSDGSYTFNPGADFDGLAAGQSRDVTFSYTATDNNGGVSAPQTVTITVTGTNDVPVAKVDTQTTGENATLTSQVPAATDVDGTVESYQLVNGVGNNNGSLSFNSDGSYTFNPGADFDGLAAGQSRDVTFSYTAADNNGGVSAPQTVTITVTGTNDAPVAVADTGNTGENTTLNVGAAQGVLANDSDVDGGTLSVSAVNGVAGSVGQAIAGSNGGTFTLNADGSYSFNPGTAFDRLAAGQTDTTQISYTVSDGQGGTATSTLTVTVTGTNDAPVARADTGSTGENATLNVTAAQGVLANDSDVDGGTLSVSAVNGVAGSVGQAIAGSNGGTFTLNADGSYSFNPGTAFDRLAAGQTDTTQISYTVSDGQGGTATATLTVTVTGTNDVPVAKADTQTTGENATLTSQVPAATDVDGTVESYQLVNGVGNNNGSLSFNSDGSYTFNPGADFDGLAAGQSRDVTFSYTATDNNGGISAPQTVTITVTGTNDVPVAKADTQTTGENATLTSQVPAATDVDGTVESYQLVNGVGNNNGSLSFNSDGSYSFNPGADFDGLAAGQSRDVTFTYTATDNNGGVSAPQTVTITVTGTNDVPVAKADTQTTGENATLNVTAAQGVLANDSDVDGGTLSVSAVNGVVGSVGQAIAGSNGGTFTLNADGSYSFNPGTAFDRLAAGQTDTTQISYTVSDGQGGTATSTLTVTVTGTNDVPVITGADTGSVIEDTNVNAAGNLTTNGALTVTDADYAQSAFVPGHASAAAGTLGTLAITAGGNWSYSVANSAVQYLKAGESKVESFTVTTLDGTTKTISVTIAGTNELPEARDVSVTGSEDPSPLIAVNLSGTDADGTIASFQLTALGPTANSTAMRRAPSSWPPVRRCQPATMARRFTSSLMATGRVPPRSSTRLSTIRVARTPRRRQPRSMSRQWLMRPR